MQDPECWTFFVSFQGSSFADRPCPASSRCWAARGAVRGRCLPPACPVGAAPRRPWIGGPESASAGDGSVLRPHHRPEGSQGQRSTPELKQALRTPRSRRARAPTARLLQTHRPPTATATGTGTPMGRHHQSGREGKMGRAQMPHPGRLGLATPLLRNAAKAARAGPAAVWGAPHDSRRASSP